MQNHIYLCIKVLFCLFLIYFYLYTFFADSIKDSSHLILFPTPPSQLLFLPPRSSVTHMYKCEHSQRTGWLWMPSVHSSDVSPATQSWSVDPTGQNYVSHLRNVLVGFIDGLLHEKRYHRVFWECAPSNQHWWHCTCLPSMPEKCPPPSGGPCISPASIWTHIVTLLVACVL